MLSPQALGVAALTVIALALLGGLVPAAVLAARAGVFAFWVAVLAVKHLITHPRQGGAVLAAALVGWLVWPYLAGIPFRWGLVVLGLIGAAVAVPAMAYAIFGQDQSGSPAPSATATQVPVSHWSQEYR